MERGQGQNPPTHPALLPIDVVFVLVHKGHGNGLISGATLVNELGEETARLYASTAHQIAPTSLTTRQLGRLGCRPRPRLFARAKMRKKKGQNAKKTACHADFPCGHPPQYYSRRKELNFGIRNGIRCFLLRMNKPW